VSPPKLRNKKTKLPRRRPIEANIALHEKKAGPFGLARLANLGAGYSLAKAYVGRMSCATIVTALFPAATRRPNLRRTFVAQRAAQQSKPSASPLMLLAN